MATTLLETSDVSVFDVHCSKSVASGAGDIPGINCFEVLFVRAGCFSFQDTRGKVLVDATTCVLGSPGQGAGVAHPAPGGDVYTQIALSAEAWHEATADERVPLAARVSGRMQVALRAMVEAGRRGHQEMAVEETALQLVAAAVAQVEPVRVASGRPGTHRSRRQLAEDARTILISDPMVSSVRTVAGRLGCSPHHLSRVFRAYTGMTLAGYRTEIRLNLVIQLLADGGIPIAEAAVLYGFADQAHLTRALRRHTGSTPGQVRAGVASLSAQLSKNVQSTPARHP